MSNYQIVVSKKASKDIKQLTDKQRQKLQQIFETILTINPYSLENQDMINLRPQKNEDKPLLLNKTMNAFVYKHTNDLTQKQA